MTKKDSTNSTKGRHILHFTGLYLFISIIVASALGLIAGKLFNHYYDQTQEKYTNGNEDSHTTSISGSSDRQRGNFSEEMKAESITKNRYPSFRNENEYLHVDIKNIDTQSVNSEKYIMDIMTEVLNQLEHSEILSHKCNLLEDSVVSCIGFLSDSHLLLRTRPKNGYSTSTLSLFARGPRKTLSDILKGVDILFKSSDPVSNAVEEGMKEGLSIDWIIKPSQDMVDHISSSPKSENEKDFGNEKFHEAFVHPAMFSHYGPKKVAVIGEGENVLREVLKHKCIEKIEIFPTIMGKSVEQMSEFSDCSDLVGRGERCDSNELVEFKEEPFNVHSLASSEESFDVIFINIDPSQVKNKQFIHKWFTNDVLVKSLYKVLSDDGMVVFKLGELVNNSNPPSSEYSKLQLTSSLEVAGFQSIHVYSESSTTFSVVMKNSKNKEWWYENAAILSLDIQKRIVGTYSGSSALKHFDSSVMNSYKIPHKAIETAHCRTTLCISVNSTKKSRNISLSDLDVKMSTVGEGSGRGLFAGVDIKKGDTIGVQETRHPVYLDASSIELVFAYIDLLPIDEMNNVYNYVDGYGWETSIAEGVSAYYVEANVLTFSNHGCKGSYNMIDGLTFAKHSSKENLNEQNAEITDYPESGPIFDPTFNRHMHHIEVSWLEASKDIKAGEEIFSDYLFYTSSSAELFYEEAQVLKRICNGEEVGLITLKEAEPKLSYDSEL